MQHASVVLLAVAVHLIAFAIATVVSDNARHFRASVLVA